MRDLRAIADLIWDAPAGSRDLDEAAAKALGWRKGRDLSGYWYRGGERAYGVPAYTTSLDALRAEIARRGWGYSVASTPGNPGGAGHGQIFDRGEDDWMGDGAVHNGFEAATPELALCGALVFAVACQQRVESAEHPKPVNPNQSP